VFILTKHNAIRCSKQTRLPACAPVLYCFLMYQESPYFYHTIFITRLLSSCGTVQVFD